MRTPIRLLGTIAAFAFLVSQQFSAAQPRRAPAPESVRLYILDCGRITGVGAAQVGFKEAEIATTEMTTPCYLIVHPRGTLMWDVGQIPDSAFKSDATPVTRGLFTVARPLLPQLEAVGYVPADITYLVLSHYHADHAANANAFASATWIVQESEREVMFAKHDPAAKGVHVPNLAYFSALEKSRTVLLKGQDYDVFGDGTVVVKFTPGHTPGHQSLFLKLARTGPVLLSGDLYHYPEELTLKRIASVEFDKEQTLRSRASIEEFVELAGAHLWIQHDSVAGARLKKAPDYYE